MANNLIQVKRTSVSGRAANTTTLPNPGELALNMTDGIMYSTNGSSVFEIGANLTSLSVTGTGTFTGNVSVSGLTVSDPDPSIYITDANTGANSRIYSNDEGDLYFSADKDNSASATTMHFFVDGFGRMVIGTNYLTSFVATGFSNVVTVDTINEYTTNTGVTIESVLLKDSNITLTGGISANGSLGTSGQVLTSNGSVAYWSTAASGSGGGYYYGDNGAVGDATNKTNIFSSYLGSDLGMWHAYLELLKEGDLSLYHGVTTRGFYEEERGIFDSNNHPQLDVLKSFYLELENLNWKSLCSI